MDPHAIDDYNNPESNPVIDFLANRLYKMDEEIITKPKKDAILRESLLIH